MRKDILVATILGLTCAMASAQDLQAGTFQAIPEIHQKHFIPGALQLQISPRGMEIFKTKLRNLIITQADFDPSEMVFDPIKKDWDRPIKLDDIQAPEETKALIRMVREMLSKWLVGFALNDLRPSIEMGDSNLEATYSKFSLVTDEDLLKSLGKTTGAVLTLEMNIKQAEFKTSSIRYFDLNNIFAKAKVDGVSLKVAGPERPLKVRIPFYVKISPQNSIEFEALRFENNLNDVDLELKYGHLIVPNVEIHIDDQVYRLNKKQLDSEVVSRLPALLGQVKTLISNFATTELPRILNEKAKQNMKAKLEEIQPLAAPGSSNPQDHFFWGLQLAEISQKTAVQVKLNAFVEDLVEFDDIHHPPNPKNAASGSANLNAAPLDSYDVGVSIDRGLINRLLQLSFERRFFEKIPLEKEKTLRLTKAPVVDVLAEQPAIEADGKTGKIKLSVSLKVPAGIVTGLKKAAIKDQFEMSMDVVAQLAERSFPDCGTKPGDKGIAILLSTVNLDSIAVDGKWFVFPIGKIFKGAVMNSIRESVKELTAEWANLGGKSVGGCISPPKEILGIKLNIGQIGVDPNGHLLMFLNYAKPAARSL